MKQVMKKRMKRKIKSESTYAERKAKRQMIK